MKKILTTICGITLTLNCFAPTEYDLKKGIDLTGQSRITASQLNQLVDAGTINTNKGLIIRDINKPDVTNNPRYTNFVWLDISSGVPGTLKQYTCCGDNNTNWVTATVGINGITAIQIADSSISSNKLATNSIFRWHINTNQVTRDQILDGEIINSKLGSLAVTGDKIYSGSVSNIHLTENIIRSSNIVDGTIVGADISSGAAITGSQLASATITSNNIDSSVLQRLPVAYGNLQYSAGAINAGNTKLYGISATNWSGTYFTLTFLNAMPNTNYCVLVTSTQPAATVVNYNQIQNKGLTTFRVHFYDSATVDTDSSFSLIVLAAP